MTDEQLIVEQRDVVVPGQVLAKGLGFLPGNGTYRDQDEVRANRVGLAQIDGKVIKLIPLAGAYFPKVGDRAIGKVVDVLISGWRIKIGKGYTAVLSLKEGSNSFIPRGEDLTEVFGLGQHLIVKITNVTSQGLIDVTVRAPGLGKLTGGRIVTVSAQKVPRVIGKDGNMIGMLRGSTGCDIETGQNGLVWLDGAPEDERLAQECLEMIDKESHLPGLTDRVKQFLESRGKTIQHAEAKQKGTAGGQRNDRDRPPRRFSDRGPPRRGPPRR